ncbi:SseB family protein [Micromonospora sp. NPDC050495]|uniref:SseB family protein n=1 Tax=Micromonospora sp. NPDC050495 TaxID=3154936 RepID=UPI0033D26738
MTGWEPATEAEVALRDALRAQDQQLYFRILTRTDLLLPVSAEALGGQSPVGWGTWTTGGRTHILAFTSVNAMRACLGENAGATRRVPYAELAVGWPNHEWWLAVNPGLPIEGYLPAWYVAQLSRGDVRLPGRTMGARARLERVENATRARATGRETPAGVTPPADGAGSTPAGWPTGPAVPGSRAPVAPATPDPAPAPAPAPVVSPLPRSGFPGQPTRPDGPAAGVPTAGRSAPARPAEPASSGFPATASPAAPWGQTATDLRGAAPPVEPATGSLPAPPVPSGRPAAPGAADPPLPPIPRRPGPPGFLAANRLGSPGRPPEGDATARDGWLRPGNGLADRAPANPSDDAADSLSGWVSDLRRRPDEPDPFADAGRGDASRSRSGEPAPPPPARSFFESPADPSRRPSPVEPASRGAERPAPPSRFAGGGRPFPRRRPLNEPVPEDPTRAFSTAAATEATPALRPGTDEEPPRAFRPAAPPGSAEETTQALPRRRPHPADLTDADERTQPIPAPGEAGFAVPAEAEELPPSLAEPVSAPPASRRGFTPIVIEGTVIEARDLTVPEPPAPARPEPVVPEPYAVPTVPVAAPATTEARVPPGHSMGGVEPVVPWAGAPEQAAPPVHPAGGGEPVAPWRGLSEPMVPPVHPAGGGEPVVPWAGAPEQAAPPVHPAGGGEPVAPWAGASEATVPLTLDPPGGVEPVGVAGRPAEPDAAFLVRSGPDGRSVDEPSAPARPPVTGSLFEPVQPPAEPTVPLHDPLAEPTVPLFGPPAEPTGPLFDPPAVPGGSPVTGETLLADSFFGPADAPSGTRPSPASDESVPPVAPADGSPGSPPVAPGAASLFTPASQPPGPTADPTGPPAGPAGTPRNAAGTSDAAGTPLDAGRTGAPTGAAEEPATPVTAATAGPTPAAGGVPVAPADFVPANEVEEELLAATSSGSTDGFLTTLLLARVLLPVAPDSAPSSRPGDPGFVWRTEQLDGGTYVVVHTSPERLAERSGGPVDTVRVKFVRLIRSWPDVSWSFAVNPGSPVGATYPGEQVLALANWAAEVGLGDDPDGEADASAADTEPASTSRPAVPPVDRTRPVTMQKAIAPSQLAYYLERGYDRVSGFVHRASELSHLRTPAELFDTLGLGHPDSPFRRDAEEIYLLRWPAYRPSLYRIPYGGQNEAAMRAMEGWVIERPPFRGNGFAPGETSDVVAEFKVDSARLPHGAELWRVGADGSERVVAVLDTDALLWRPVEPA